MMMMAIQKILLSVVSKFVVGVCDGLDACVISRPEIMSQSAPDCIQVYKCIKDQHLNGVYKLNISLPHLILKGADPFIFIFIFYLVDRDIVH